MLYLLRETNSRYSNQLPKEKRVDSMTGNIVLAFSNLSEWGRVKKEQENVGL